MTSIGFSNRSLILHSRIRVNARAPASWYRARHARTFKRPREHLKHIKNALRYPRRAFFISKSDIRRVKSNFDLFDLRIVAF